MSRRVPISTYRLQLNHRFRFADARRLVSYLRRLGVSDCYSSPHLKAAPGSMHGYDICDHTQLNPELGAEEDYAAFTDELRANEMGHVVDIVPNHMGADPDANPWWRDLLEDGPSSRYARFFDVDWDPVKRELRDRVLLPILGDQYGAVLDRGELRLAFEEGTFALRYFEHTLPLNPRQLPRLLEHELDALQSELGEEDPDLNEFLSILTSLRNLPAYTESEAERVAERHREKEVARHRLERLVAASPRIRAHVERAVAAVDGVAGRPETWEALHELLELQPYRLSYWRTASHEINYRRFFDINTLAGVRMEDPEVFATAHALLLRLIGEGRITGLRVDHVDGLFDPAGYLERLQGAAEEAGSATAAAGDATLDRLLAQPLYVAVEKILSRGESLPADWRVAGTSGYDFLNQVNALFVDRRGAPVLQRLYGRFTGRRQRFADLLHECKQLIMDTSMASELNVLAHALNRISEQNRHTRDFTLNSLREALREVVASFPVYRTYVAPAGFTDTDREIVETSLRDARRRNPAMEASVFAFLRAVLLPRREDARTDEEHAARVRFAMKFQQYTGPLEAKGLEDTAFYRRNVLVSLNEVGADPERFGSSVAEFHAANRQRRADWPLEMLATATHDTKRGEDVRARLDVLSELPEEWGRVVSASARANASNRTTLGGEPAPDRNDEYLLYQLLLGVWPPGADAAPGAAFVERVCEAMLKAAREAKEHTSWVAADEAYEQAVVRFVERTLAGPATPRFLAAFLPFQKKAAFFGMLSSLAQVVLKVASPGVPDFYQGTELWDLNLVDPDNRRPVDYDLRRRLLDELEPALAEEAGAEAKRDVLAALLRSWEDGRVKLFVTAAALRLRRRLPRVFLAGDYEPLEVGAAHSEHVVAFARRFEGASAIAVTPRFTARLTHGEPRAVPAETWGDERLALPAGMSEDRLRNVFTGETVPVHRGGERPELRLADVLASFPVALLVAAE